MKALHHESGLLWQGLLVTTLCTATSGVAQGCPLSGSLFVIVMDPVLRWIHDTLHRHIACMERACVDDLAIALRSVRFVAHLAPIFGRAESAAALRLKPTTCKAIVLAEGDAVEQARELRDVIAGSAEEWSEFEVVRLGISLGAPLSWEAPLAKWRGRIEGLVCAAPAAMAASVQYKSHTLLVFSDVLAVMPAPADLASLERDAVGRILRLPGSMPSRGIVELSVDWGFRRGRVRHRASHAGARK